MTHIEANDKSAVDVTFDLQQVSDWLDIVYSETPGLIQICSHADWAGRFFELPEQSQEALQYVNLLNLRKVQGIYLRSTTLKSVPLPNADGSPSRGKDVDSFFIPGLWADVDIAGPGHKTAKPLPPDIEAAVSIVTQSGLPEPSHWIHSGGGLYPWWLLHTPAEITDMEYMRGLSAGWQKAIESSAQRLGYFYGAGVGDLSRVLRIPGTINRKAADNPRPCTELEGLAWSGPLYTLEQLAEGLAQAQTLFPVPEVPQAPRTKLQERLNTRLSVATSGERPGDEFNRKADWHDLLPGWEWVYQRSGKWHIRRPGKTDGISATIDATTGKLYVFSDATAFEPNKPYSKFEAYTHLDFGGDYSAAAKDLAGRGLGTQRDRTPESGFWGQPVADVEPAEGVQVATSSRADVTGAGMDHNALNVVTTPRFNELNETGQGKYMSAVHGTRFREVSEENSWRAYKDGVWDTDRTKQVRQAAESVADDFGRIAEYAMEQALASGDKAAMRRAEKLDTKANAAKSDRGISAIVNRFSDQPGISCSAQEFDREKHLIALRNGTFNLKTMRLEDHSPQHMLTKKIDIAYDANATAPRWEQAVKLWVPDETMRDYLQRAIGYTLTGKVNHSAFFVLHGKTGCGKSTFFNVMNAVFDQYAQTAATSTFRTSRYGEKSGHDLHMLRGTRFVATSESSENTQIDEELIKRVTGGDSVASRAMYQSHITWKPQFALWMGTNFLPKMSSEDSAIWRRVKPIEFPSNFTEEGEQQRERQFGLDEYLIENELPGILNWVLQGVAMFSERGLSDPQQMQQDVAEYRTDADPVSQFLADASDEGVIRVETQATVRTGEIYRIYAAWSVNNGRKPIGEIRFGQRLSTLGFEAYKGGSGVRHRRGLGVNPEGWIGERQTPVYTQSWWT